MRRSRKENKAHGVMRKIASSRAVRRSKAASIPWWRCTWKSRPEGRRWAVTRSPPAARFADDLKQRDLATRYGRTAQRLKEAVARIMWDDEENRFVRAVTRDENGRYSMDKTLDSAVAGLWYFGMFDPADPRIVATMEAVRQKLWVHSPVGGIARYENDQYHKVVSEGDQIPGNPWFVCTLWLAQWYLRKARTADDLAPAAELIRWAASRALPNGLMAEQIHPFTDEPLSACPLTWSHSAFVLAVHEYMTKCRALQCGGETDLLESAEPQLQWAQAQS